MLILTRKLGQTIVIDGDINVQILGMRGSQIRIGISAPHKISVHREEVYQRIKAEEMGTREIRQPQSNKPRIQYV